LLVLAADLVTNAGAAFLICNDFGARNASEEKTNADKSTTRTRSGGCVSEIIMILFLLDFFFVLMMYVAGEL